MSRDTGSAGNEAGDGAVDPVTLEVLRNACRGVAEEMNATLVRTAHSPNITDRRDWKNQIHVGQRYIVRDRLSGDAAPGD